MKMSMFYVFIPMTEIAVESDYKITNDKTGTLLKDISSSLS